MGWLLKLLGSGILSIFGDAILKPVLDHLGKKADAETDRYKAGIEATIRANEQRRSMASEFKWIVYAFAVPCILHFAAVMLDSTFAFGWGLPKAPPPYDGYERDIILSFFILQPANMVAKGLSSWLSR